MVPHDNNPVNWEAKLKKKKDTKFEDSLEYTARQCLKNK